MMQRVTSRWRLLRLRVSRRRLITCVLACCMVLCTIRSLSILFHDWTTLAFFSSSSSSLRQHHQQQHQHQHQQNQKHQEPWSWLPSDLKTPRDNPLVSSVPSDALPRVSNSESQRELTTWPHAIEDGGDLVVFWSNCSKPTLDQDFLTISCGSSQGVGDFLQRQNVTSHDVEINSVRFKELYMMRCNYTVRYFAYDPRAHTYYQAGQVTVGMKESFATPKHGHLALTSDEHAMSIMFNSASNRTPSVRYGLSRDALTNRADGTSTTYQATDMCDVPATITSQRFFRDPGYMHTVLMKDLAPGHEYFYQYGNEEDGWSAVNSFKSKPSRDVQEVKFVAYADLGVDPAPAGQATATAVYQEVVRNGYDSFLLHFGDISYARGLASVWDQFFHMIEPIATRVPYMISIGNHEYDYWSGGEHDPSNYSGKSGNGFHPFWGNYGNDSGGECSVPMYHRWHVPQNGHSIYWYSFDYGSVHVVQLSSEHNWTRGSDQYEWIKRDLELVDRTVTPWVVVTAHRMMYSTQLGRDGDLKLGVHFREEMEDLLYANRVNVMLVGHQHSYERSCAVYRERCMEDGKATVHFTVGTGGNDPATTNFSRELGEWSVSHVNEYGFLRVHASASEMQLQFIKTRDGAVYDQVSLQPWL